MTAAAFWTAGAALTVSLALWAVWRAYCYRRALRRDGRNGLLAARAGQRLTLYSLGLVMALALLGMSAIALYRDAPPVADRVPPVDRLAVYGTRSLFLVLVAALLCFFVLAEVYYQQDEAGIRTILDGEERPRQEEPARRPAGAGGGGEEASGGEV
jgi:hypothetical protein